MKIKKLNENFEVIEEIDTPEVAEKEVIEECNDLTEQAVRDYREFANIDESFEITAESIDNWALNEAAVKNNIQTYDLKHVLLKEEKTIDQAARELEADVAKAQTDNQVARVLDRALDVAQDMIEDGETSDFPNVLFVSDAGFGKTDMIVSWAKSRNVNLVPLPLGTTDPATFSGMVARDADDPKYAKRLGTKELVQSLSKPNSVLFLDEYNRSKTEIRGTILTLIQNHKIWDPTAENSQRFLPTFLFTVAAMNPSNSTYKGAKEIDPAEKTRFRRIPLMPDPMEHLKFIRSYLQNKINNAKTEQKKLANMGRLAIAETILTDPRFTYDTALDIENNSDYENYIPLNYRSFMLALKNSDGTKDDFIDVWNDFCNFKKKHIIEDILKDYVDIEDKANDAIKADSESSVFKKEMGNRSKLKKAFAELNI